MVRDILNYQGTVIGQMELPDDTTEEQWAAKLAPYAVAPESDAEKLNRELSRTVEASRLIATEIIEEFKLRNLKYFLENNIPNDLAIMMSLHVHHRLRAVNITVGGVPFTIDLLNLVISGDLETAFVVLSYMEPDDMSQPYHFWDEETIGLLRQSIADRVGL